MEMEREIKVYGLQGCCGINEMQGLSGFSVGEFRSMLAGMEDDGELNHGAFLIFSQATGRHLNRKYGEEFASFIRKHNLGTLASPPAKINPNSENLLKVWLWGPNMRGITTFLRAKERVKKVKKVAKRKGGRG